MTDGVDLAPPDRGVGPVRMCVGCRQRSGASDLIRVVVGESEGHQGLIPDPHHRAPGRGAHVHPRTECVDLAERRRAFPRALRVSGPLDIGALRVVIEGRTDAGR